MIDPSRNSDLDWIALQYVSGILSEDDLQKFEQRLVHSQEAREAVARAVEITLAVKSACRDYAVKPLLSPVRADSRLGTATHQGRDFSIRRRRSRTVLAVGACVLFAIGWQATVWLNHRGGLPSQDVVVAVHDELIRDHRHINPHKTPGDLTLLWTEMRLLGERENDEDAHVFENESDEGETMADLDAAVEELDSPSWMLIAIAGMQETRRENSDATPEEDTAGAMPEALPNAAAGDNEG